MRKRLWAALGILSVALCLPLAAAAHPDDDGVVDSGKEIHGNSHGQHGSTAGHLPAGSQNVRLVGKMRINQDQGGRVSDVGVHGNYAYIGAFYEPKCQKGGVYVFDISNLSAPKQINFIRTANDSYVGEGVQVIRIDTPEYQGDVLVLNNEICGKGAQIGAIGGISLVDVTNPKVHKYLAEGVGDFTPAGRNGANVAHESHSAFAWDAGDKAYVVMVDNEQSADVDILDITNPSKPKLVAEYDLDAQFPQIVDPVLGAGSSFLHDMVVKEIGGRQIMLASYWDGGYVLLDVTDPANATYVGDSDFSPVDPEAAESGLSVKPEGNAHEAEFTSDNAYIVAADEDFNPYTPVARNVTDGTDIVATQGDATPAIDEDTSLAGRTVFVGRACPGDPAVPAATAAAKIAVVERGVCTFTEKVAAVENAGGYEGVIVFNREGSDACSDLLNMAVEGSIPALFVNRPTGYDLLNVAGYDETSCRAGSGQAPVAIGTIGDEVDFRAIFDGWGYLHLYRNGSGKLVETDTFAIPQAHDTAFASGFGDLSVHEVATSHRDPRLVYTAYYAAGFRVLRIEGDQLVERGHFIDEGGNNFWGVQVFQKDGKEYVAASDRDYGLYVFEYTGP